MAHVAPEVAERAEQASLDRQELRAQRARYLTLTRCAGGGVRLSGLLDREGAAIVQAALQPLCRPQPGEQRIPGQQRADALVEVCQLALRGGDLPEHGGDPLSWR